MLADTHVVTCFLRHRGEVLLLRRSADVGSYRGRWGAVAGHVEKDDPDASALREIAEETGLDQRVRLASRGASFPVEDEGLGKRWIVHPYLFDCDSRDARLDWESVAGEWVSPAEILRRDTVPRLWRSYERVGPTPESIAADGEHGSSYLSLRALEALRDRGAVLAHDEVDGASALDELRALAERLLSARASMAVIENRIGRVMHRCRESFTAGSVETETHAAIGAAIAADEESARRASDLVAGKRVLTLSRSGTVLAALLASNPPAFVAVAESRPRREGVKVAEELASSGLEVALVTDAAMALAIESFSIDVVLVGADAILPSGGVVNKTGTRLAALAASERGLPVYAVAAIDKISTRAEVRLESSAAAEIYEGEANLKVANVLFELTPPALVRGVITERGVLAPGDVTPVARELAELGDWRR